MKTLNKNFIIGLILGILIMSGVVLVSQIGFAQEADFGLRYVEEEVQVYGPTDLRVIVARIIQIVFSVLGIIAVVLVLYGGFMWMTAAGNEERVSKAKKVLTGSLIGLAIMLTSFAIVSFILNRWTSNFIAQSCEPIGSYQACTYGGCTGYKYCMASGLWGPCTDLTCYDFPGWCDDPGGTDPYLCEILPNHGPEEINVTIRGYRFGDYDPDTSAVYFDDIKAEIAFCDTTGNSSWNDREIMAVVPRGLLTDPNSLLPWKYRKKITIQSSQVANTSQQNFPVLVKATLDTAKVQDDAGDVLFALPANEWNSGTPEFRLAHEIESYNFSTGELVAWVKAPEVSATVNTEIYMYYGNPSAANQDQPDQVWPADYMFVNHLHDNPEGQLRDSTANGYNAIPRPENAMASDDRVSGKINSSIVFKDGHYGEIPTTGSSHDNVTISAWVYIEEPPAGDNYWRVALTKGGETSIDIACEMNENNKCGCDLYNGIARPVDIGYNTWTLITCTYDGSKMTQYINGINNATESSAGRIFDDKAWIGIGRGTSYAWNGIIDEARLSSVAKSADWIKTEYNNQSSPEAFYTIGSEEQATDVPELLESKLVNVRVEKLLEGEVVQSGAQEGADEFTVELGEPGPSIDCIVPEYGPAGITDLTIEGKRFGEFKEGSSAYFKDYVTEEETMCTIIDAWDDELIETKVPENIDSSDVYARVGGIESNGAAFLVTCEEDADCLSQCCWPNLFSVMQGETKVWLNGCVEFWKCEAVEENFYVENITPQGEVLIRNVVPRIFFNADANLDDVNNNITITETATGLDVAGIFRIAGDEEGNFDTGKNIEFIPDALCPEPNQDLRCFEANTQYTVTIDSGMVSNNGIIIDCSGINICEATFTTGELIDTESPTIQMTQPPDRGYVCQDPNTIVTARATDDAGVSYVDFYADNELFSTSSDISGSTVTTQWNTSLLEVNSWHKLKAIAHDYDYNSAESSEISVQVLAAHCCDGQENEDEDGIDCGGADCRACEGGWCHLGPAEDFDESGNLVSGVQCNAQNEMCRSLYCSPIDCKCKDQPLILEVTPDNGYVDTIISIWGANFGEPFKYFENNQIAPYHDFNVPEDFDQWTKAIKDGAAEIVDQEIHAITTNNEGANRSDVRIITPSLSVESGKWYKFKFKARSEGSREAYLRMFDHTNSNYVDGVYVFPGLNENEKEYTYIFKLDLGNGIASTEDARFQFFLGADENDVWLDDFYFDELEGRVYFMAPEGQPDLEFEAEFMSELKSSYCIDHWDDNLILIQMPNDMYQYRTEATWPIRVYSNYEADIYDDTTDERGVLMSFEVNANRQPGLCAVEPGQGNFGHDLEVRGVNFQTFSDVVFGGGDNIVSAAQVEMFPTFVGTAKVPNIVKGNNIVRISNEGTYSNGMEFYVGAVLGPEIVIDYINPERGGIGQYVTIFGKGFGDSEGRVDFISQASGIVYPADTDFPEYCESTDYWKNNMIIVKVPSVDLGDYDISVTRSDGAVSDNTAEFTVTQDVPTPGLCKINPDNGPVGILTNLYGEFLEKQDADTENDKVRFWPYDNAANSIDLWPDQIWTNEKIENIPVPVSTETGPVRAVVDGTLSNEMLFEVGYCTAESCEVREQVCCPAGSEYEGSCMDSFDDCVVVAPECTYQWAFSTGKLLRPVPVVVDSCECTESPQSPSPRDLRSDCTMSAQNFCINGAISARFTTEMNPQTMKDKNNILLQPCLTENGEKDLDGDCRFLGNPIRGTIRLYSHNYQLNETTITEDGFIMYPGQELDSETWYNVRLIGGVLGLKSKYNVPLGGFTEFYEYRWKFKTSTQRCVPTKVNVMPSYTYLNSATHDPANGLYAKDSFTAYANNDDCYIIANISWNFNFEPEQAENATTNTSVAEDCVSRCEGAGCSPACFYDYCCGTTDNVEVTAVAEGTDKVIAVPTKYPDITDYGLAHVDFSLFKIIGYAPNCDSACGNAAVRFSVNRPADPVTVSTSSVMLFECDAEENPNCDINYPYPLARPVGVVGIEDISASASTAFRLDLGGVPLNLGSLYRVVLSPTNLKVGESFITNEIKSKPRAGSSIQESVLELRNDLDKNGELDSFSWTFFVGQDYCYPYRTTVIPSPWTFKTPTPKYFAGAVRSAPDECNANGQELPSSDYSWIWDINDNNIVDFADEASLYYRRLISPENEGNTLIYAWTTFDNNIGEDVEGFVAIKQPAQVNVAYSNIVVVDKWPDCFTACENASAGARFNIEPMQTRINKDYIKVYECGKTCQGTADPCATDAECDEGISCVDDCSIIDPVPEEDYLVELSNINEFLIRTPAGKEFDTTKRHKVVIFGINPEDLGSENPDLGIIGRENSEPLGGLNNDFDNDGELDSFAWEFAYEEDKVCIMSRASIVPSYTALYAIGAEKLMEVHAFSEPDECSENGQRLKAENYGWDWTRSKDIVTLVQPYLRWYDEITDDLIEIALTTANYKGARSEYYDLTGQGYCENEYNLVCENDIDCSPTKICLSTKNTENEITCSTNADCGKYCSNDIDILCEIDDDCKVCSNDPSTSCIDAEDCDEGASCVTGGRCSVVKDRCDYKYNCLPSNTSIINATANNENNEQIVSEAYASVVCAFESDEQCVIKNDDSYGLGLDTCCYKRPVVESTIPFDMIEYPDNPLATEVCRNAAIMVNFDQKVTQNSLLNNIIMEANFGSDPCTSVETYKTYNSATPEWYRNLNNLAIDELSKKIVLGEGQTAGTWNVFYDSEIANNIWRKITWSGYTPDNPATGLDTSITVRARSAAQATTETDSELGKIITGLTDVTEEDWIDVTPALIPYTAEFNGTGDYVFVQDSESLDFLSAMTISAWVYPTEDYNWSRIVSKYYWFNSVDYGAFITMLRSDNNKAMFSFKNTSEQWCSLDSESPVNQNEWTHLVFTYDGAQSKIYINGELDSERDCTGNIFNSALMLGLGASFINNSIETPQNIFDGKLDNIRLYDRALSDQEISNLYNSVSVPVSGLVSYYSFDSKNADDAAGINNGEIHGDLQFVSAGDRPNIDNLEENLSPLPKNRYIEVEVTLNSTLEDNSPQLDYLTIKSGGIIGQETVLEKAIRFIKNIFIMPVQWIGRIFGIEAWAQAGNWCPVSITANENTVTKAIGKVCRGGANAGFDCEENEAICEPDGGICADKYKVYSKVSIAPSSLLDPFRVYRITLLGQNPTNPDVGIKSDKGVTMAENYEFSFLTSNAVCSIDQLEVNIYPPGLPIKNDLFACSGDTCEDDICCPPDQPGCECDGMTGAQHMYQVYVKDQRGFNLQSYPGAPIYYLWEEIDPRRAIGITDATFESFPSVKSCDNLESILKETIIGEDGSNHAIYTTGCPQESESAAVKITAYDGDPENIPDIGRASETIDISVAMCYNPIDWSEQDYYFKTNYCRDSGTPEDISDDLPILEIIEITP